ncbi:MAG: sodium:solute symporter [Spirochaetes bacterium]|nr:sodium:solute symporter [Spirochaetota bacterium]
MYLDAAIIVIYMAAINIIGVASSKVRSVEDYFLGNRSIPWPVACFSIVATETSSLTFISIPGLAYISGTGFLQVALGYVLGRMLVAAVLLPRYFAGNLETAYQFLQNRFGIGARKAIAVLFHATRLLADGIRLFATAIPLSMLLGFDGYWQAILIIGLTTFAYTLYGGIRSVAITDSIQLGIYIISAIAGICVISNTLGLSVPETFGRIPESGLVMFSTGISGGWRGVFGSYNVFSGLIGGALLSFASHGTDHLIVQRVLSCRGLIAARKAMIWSGIIVFFQFALFMIWGLCIYVMLGGKEFELPDTIMPYFIVNHVPYGIRGVMLAGIFAAAMSTLSASINSISSSTVMDILMIPGKNISERLKVRISRAVSFGWCCVMMAVAMLLRDTKSPLVELGLSIASITYGGMLGIFVQAALFRDFSDRASLVGVAASIIAVLVVMAAFNVFWPWFVPIGFAVSFFTGTALNRVMNK